MSPRLVTAQTPPNSGYMLSQRTSQDACKKQPVNA